MIHQHVPGSGRELSVLLLHGEGGDENDLIPIGRALAPGAELISPRLALGVGSSELAEFAKGFAPARMIALGYSAGADIATALMLFHPEVLAGAILLRPGAAEAPTGLPDVLPNLAGRRVTILAGEHDAKVPPETTKALASLLSRTGAEVEVHWMDADHDLGPGDFQAIQQAFI